MRVERVVDSKVKESLGPATPAQSGIPIPLVFIPEERVLRTIVRVDNCTCVESWCCTPEGKTVSSIFREGESSKPAHQGYCKISKESYAQRNGRYKQLAGKRSPEKSGPLATTLGK